MGGGGVGDDDNACSYRWGSCGPQEEEEEEEQVDVGRDKSPSINSDFYLLLREQKKKTEDCPCIPESIEKVLIFTPSTAGTQSTAAL